MTHILIVANNTLTTRTIATSLQSDNVVIHCADTTQCLISLCRKHHIELIIFLSLSPYFSSMNIVDYIRTEIEYMPKIYVVSNSHSQTTILMLLECGVDQYLTFPVNLYRLRDKVLSQFTQQ